MYSFLISLLFFLTMHLRPKRSLWIMALAHRTRQRGGQSPSCFLMAGVIRKQDGDWPPRCRVAASCVPELLSPYQTKDW